MYFSRIYRCPNAIALSRHDHGYYYLLPMFSAVHSYAFRFFTFVPVAIWTEIIDETCRFSRTLIFVLVTAFFDILAILDTSFFGHDGNEYH